MTNASSRVPGRGDEISEPILRVEDIRVAFKVQAGILRAVNGVSFEIARGETLGLVGESGCGKSTVARAILRLSDTVSGRIVLDGADVTRLSRRAMHPHRRHMQMVFQDPYASLNPRMRVERIIAEPLRNYRSATSRPHASIVAELLKRVGLPAESAAKYPHEFSGGQRQRLGIARALAVNPLLIVADEPVSALDVSVQAQVINLMKDLQAELGIAYLFISHDIGVIEHVSQRVAVMYLGRIVEIGKKESLFDSPLHPYTEGLLQAAPVADPNAKRLRRTIAGEVPSPINPPTGCQFHPRCPIAVERCRVEAPDLREVRPGHSVSCHLR